MTEHARAAAPDPAAPPVTVERVERAGFARPHGRRFGTLVHAVLAEIPFAATTEEIQRAATLQGRYLGSTAAEVDAAGVTVAEALRHPLLRRAGAASVCRRELPLALRLDDGTVLDGVVDLAFADGDGPWTVVDLKTDLGVAGERAAYEEQVRLYARAIGEATGRPARGVLLYL